SVGCPCSTCRSPPRQRPWLCTLLSPVAACSCLLGVGGAQAAEDAGEGVLVGVDYELLNALVIRDLAARGRELDVARTASDAVVLGVDRLEQLLARAEHLRVREGQPGTFFADFD